MTYLPPSMSDVQADVWRRLVGAAAAVVGRGSSYELPREIAAYFASRNAYRAPILVGLAERATPTRDGVSVDTYREFDAAARAIVGLPPAPSPGWPGDGGGGDLAEEIKRLGGWRKVLGRMLDLDLDASERGALAPYYLAKVSSGGALEVGACWSEGQWQDVFGDVDWTGTILEALLADHTDQAWIIRYADAWAAAGIQPWGRVCDRCGDRYHPDDLHYFAEEEYCDACYGEAISDYAREQVREALHWEDPVHDRGIALIAADECVWQGQLGAPCDVDPETLAEALAWGPVSAVAWDLVNLDWDCEYPAPMLDDAPDLVLDWTAVARAVTDPDAWSNLSDLMPHSVDLGAILDAVVVATYEDRGLGRSTVDPRIWTDGASLIVAGDAIPADDVYVWGGRAAPDVSAALRTEGSDAEATIIVDAPRVVSTLAGLPIVGDVTLAVHDGMLIARTDVWRAIVARWGERGEGSARTWLDADSTRALLRLLGGLAGQVKITIAQGGRMLVEQNDDFQLKAVFA